MTDFLQYVVQQVKSKNISELDAIDILRQYEEGSTSTRFGPLHPLIHQNTSTLLEHRFTSEFFNNESLISDIRVKGQCTLPGLACVEMAAAAVLQAIDTKIISDVNLRLYNIRWSLPITVGEDGIVIHTMLIPESDGSINFEIYSKAENAEENPVVYCQGHVAIAGDVSRTSVFNISDFREKCEPSRLNAADCYQVLERAGVEYGSYFRVVEEVFVGESKVLAKLSLPEFIAADADKLVLHPGLLDGVLQVSLCLELKENGGSGLPLLPLALEELKVFHPLGNQVWALIRATGDGDSKGKQLNIDLCDDNGRVCAQLKGLNLHVLEGDTNKFKREEEYAALMVQPCWREQSVNAGLSGEAYAKLFVVFCESVDDVLAKIENQNEKQLNGVTCVNLRCEHIDIGVRYETYAAQILELLQTVLFDKPKVPVLVQLVIPYRMSEQVDERSVFSGLLGLLKTAHLENPKLKCQVIEVDVNIPAETLIEYLLENSSAPGSAHICYRDGKRWEADWREVEEVFTDSKTLSLPWKAGGVYLITGGAGGLGLMFADNIVRHVSDANVILTGRSSLSEEKLKSIEALRTKGAKITYRQADIIDRQAVLDLMQNIQEEFGTLNGIIHSAGLIRDNFILNKTKEELHEVLAPKVAGLLNLDQATLGVNLDFMVVFSSMAGALGNVGQADYAVGNAFMDAYTHYRNRLVEKGQRRGHTVSINWPLWKDGGMHIDEHSEQAITQSTGMIALKTETGLRAFYQVIDKSGQWMIMEGIRDRMRERLLGKAIFSSIDSYRAPATDNATPEVDIERLSEKTLHHIKKLFGEIVKLAIEKIASDEPLESYGIDSIVITKLNRQLGEVFGELSKTLLYEYRTLSELTEYFLAEHQHDCLRWTGMEQQLTSVAKSDEPALKADNVGKQCGFPTLISFRERTERKPNSISYLDSSSNFSLAKGQHTKWLSFSLQDKDPIAIIGISGRYPQAKNLDEYWQNLVVGRDCITEVPSERWSLENFFVEDVQTAVEQGKSYSKWGGFIAGFDEFDPLFFGISPREAINMDPQERLFLQSCWHTFEDAGYTRERLKQQHKKRVGVFAGITKTGFELYGPALWQQGEQVFPHTSFSSVANRLSYIMDLHGPSMPIDTMCSSSLTAIHEACEHLYRGDCEVAIAGGVNIYLHPSNYVGLCSIQMLAVDGQCKSFGEGGNGFVPGEGVGTVLLKPLSRAEIDRDHIYATIRATSINHGGKTNGYTVPNPTAQGELVRETIEKAGVDARTISYIEAHGTGTALGDPIEVAGLTQAFRKDTQDTQYCALGSAKSNIGHLESAAGIAGLTKIILQMQYQKLVPSLHAQRLNSNINFEQTPFVVQQELSEWKRPEIEQNGERREYPRIAGVSSFGAGGANAHVIVEEYVPGTSTQTIFRVTSQQPALVVLSSKTDKQLKVYAEQLLDYVEQQTEIQLADLAYTLQIGREAMEERVGLLVDGVETLKERLQQYVKGEKGIEDLHSGRVKQNKDTLGMFIADTEFQEAVAKWIERGKYTKLLELWVKGFEVDWTKLYGDEQPRRISLPVYPFAKERYWLDIGRETSSLEKGDSISKLHPLLHQNTSTLTEQRFSSLFSRNDEWVGQQIKGESILPGMAYLEMACAAVIKASDLEDALGLQLNNMVWAQPVVITEQRCSVHISLYPVTADRIGYEIYSELDSPDAPLVHGQGHVVIGECALAPVLTLAELKEQCQVTRLGGADVYRSLHSQGMDVGVAYHCLHEVFLGDRQLLASLRLPSSVDGNSRQFTLDPGLLDAALQAAITGWVRQSGVTQPVLPYSLTSLHLYHPCVAEMWASIHYTDRHASVSGPTVALDIDLCDDSGRLCVQLKGLVLRMLEGSIGISTQSPRGTLMVQPQWRIQAAEIQSDVRSQRWEEHLIVLCEPGEGVESQLSQQLTSCFKDIRCLSTQCEHADLATRYNTYVQQVFEQLRAILSSKPKAPVLVQVVIPCSDDREGEEEKAVFSGLSGLLRTAHQENPKLIGQLIETSLYSSQVEALAERLVENRSLSAAPDIRYRNHKREVLEWHETGCVADNSERIHPLPWKEEGIYLITGGAGGLGLLFANDIAQKVNNATLILTGRSPLSEAKAEYLSELETRCARVEYRQVDVADPSAVEKLLRDIEKAYGGLNGIVHSAGVIQDNFILNKTAEEVRIVLAPKVSGLVNLDQASRKMKLDFLVVFSSMSGALGNVGQADYAAANAFMDAYVYYRNRLVATGRRQGRTVSVNWPLWKTGGMQMDAQAEQSMVERTGMIALQSDSGIRALYQALAASGDQWMVMEGELALMRERVLGYGRASQPATHEILTPEPGEDIDRERVYEKTLYSLRRLFGNVAKLEVARVEPDEPLEQYGIDSIMIAQLNRQLGEVFGALSKTLFYEYQTLAELTGYFLDEHWPACLRWTGMDAHHAEKSTPVADVAIKDRVSPAPPKTSNDFPVLASFKTKEPKMSGGKAVSMGRFALAETGGAIRETIAIIGMSGRYPQANNLEEFWQNLAAGKDCISEIPEDRWSLENFFAGDQQTAVEQGKSYSKWGGFVEGFAEFDPLFFNISPRDALNIDPQERLFLQCCWHTLEDAGYTREVMTHRHNNHVGVFVGITKTGFDLYGPELWQQGEKEFPHTSFSSVANRFSYFMNLQGPSMSIDTMCSASLTAVHEACEHLYHGDCEMAIAGGVNLYLHPSTYVWLCALRMLSMDGKCKSFGEGGNGFVPGEGVGAVLLKPVSQAELDGDHIYAMICSTSINHGGKTNGYTVPSPNAQGELVRTALNKAGLSARTISYIEAHGTGTKLGDPIEVTGLSQAFKLDTQDTQFCALGSIKSNIGHLEAAAGIAGLTKIVLQMQHKQLVPSLHAKNLNTNIDFTRTPFVVQRELCKWVRPKIEQNGTVREFSRIAGISSFGAGGSNAHVIIEEYIPSVMEKVSTEKKKTIQPVILSAKNDAQLKIYKQQLLCYINLNPEVNLEDLVFTLQVGREAMEERIGLVVESIKELEEKLQEHLNDGKGVEGLYCGSSKQSKEVFGVLSSDEIFKEAIDKWMQMGQYGKLVELWVKGVDINWWKMYGDRQPKRISLPVYPFVKDRYWIDLDKKHRNNKTKYTSKTIPPFHPLLHRRNSELLDKEFISTFTGEEFFLKDHIVQGRRVLPGVAYLEMVRAAFERIIKDNLKGQKECQTICLRNIVWIKPIVVEDRPVNIHVTFTPKGNHELTFKVFQECGSGNVKQVVNCQGKAMLIPESEALNVDIQTLEMECNQGLLMSDYCYKAFLDNGIDYGPGFRGVDKIFVGKNQVLAKLSLPSSVYDSYADFELHPSIMDSALQASIGLIEVLKSRPLLERAETEFNSIAKPSIPFALEELEFIEKCSTRSWVWIRYTTSSNADKASSVNTGQGGFQKLDIDLCDESGKICVKMRGFTSRTLEKKVGRILKKEVGVPGKGYPADYYREKYSHPLVHKDNSTTNDILFTSVFTGEEFFLADHIVQGIKVLPGVAYLEMVRAAGELASQKTVVSLKSNVWLRPFQVYEEAKELSIRLDNKGHHYEFQVFSIDEVDKNTTNVHFQGKILVEDESQGNSLGYINIQEIESRCVLTDHETISKVFTDLGFGGSWSGSSFHAMQKFRYNDKEGLAELQLPACVKNGNEAYILHPSMMDVAFESVQLLYCFINQDKATRLPFSLRELWIHGAIPERAYAYVTSNEKLNYQNSNSEYDIYITDIKGRVIVLFKGYVSLPLQNKVEDKKVVFATPYWQIKALSKRESNLLSATPIFILASSLSGCEEEIRKKWPESKFKILSSYKEDLGKWVCDNFIMVFNCIKSFIKESNNVSRPIFILVPERESYIYSALSGLLRTAKLENSRLLVRVIKLTIDNLRIPEFLVEAIQQEVMDDGADVEIRFSDKGVREVKGLREVSFPSKHIMPINFQAGEVIWITGGFGGLGLLFAKYMGIEKKVKVILTGRSDFGSDKMRTLELLQQDGVDATYIQGDISNKDDVKKVVEQISNQYGKLTGIIHAAGINKDAYIFNKSVEEIQCVLEPKVAGILTLDEVTQSVDLKFMVLFSSLSAFGNAGQADYAGANSFLDAFAEYRNQQVEQGRRYGKTISLNWPLWKEGGMTMDSQSEKMMEHRTGMVSMDTHVGIKAFESVLSDSYTQVIVAQGNIEKIRSKLFAPLHEMKEDKKKVYNEPRLIGIVDEKDNKSSIFMNMVQQDLVNLASKMLRIEPEKINVTTELSNYGFDSIKYTELSIQLNQLYKVELMPTELLAHSTLSSLRDYLVECYSECIVESHRDVACENNIQKEGQAETNVTENVFSDEDVIKSLHQELLGLISNILNIDPDKFDSEVELSSYGADSIKFTELANKLNDSFSLELMPTELFAHPTLLTLRDYLFDKYSERFHEKYNSFVNDKYSERFHEKYNSFVNDENSEQKNKSKAEFSVNNYRNGNVLKSVYKRLVELVSDIFDMPPDKLDPNTELSSYGIDSIKFTELANQLNQIYSLELMPTELLSHPTISSLGQYLLNNYSECIQKNDAAKEQAIASTFFPVNQSFYPELIHLNKNSKGRPVFWFHDGVGGVEIYRPIADKSSRPFYGIQARGWMSDSQPLAGIQEIAKYYIEIIKSVQKQGPYDFGGFSLGGVIAYEVTRQLQDDDQIVDSIVMLDSPGTELLRQIYQDTKTAMLQAVNIYLRSRFSPGSKKYPNILISNKDIDIDLKEDDFLNHLIALVKAKGLTISDEDIAKFINRYVKIQRYYELDKFCISSLKRPSDIKCFYFGNKSKVFFGSNELYNTIADCDSKLNYENSWEEWGINFKEFYYYEVDSLNHSEVITNPKSYDAIVKFCGNLYVD